MQRAPGGRMLLLGSLGLGLVAMGIALGQFAPWNAVIAALGAAMAAPALAGLGLQRSANRQDLHDLEIFKALHEDAEALVLLVDEETAAVLWQNAAARTRSGAVAPRRAHELLTQISADPLALATRLNAQAKALGLARHRLPLADHDWTITVRYAGHGRLLWDIATQPQADPRDSLPFDIVQTTADGRITYLSPRCSQGHAKTPRHIADLFEFPLPKAGLLSDIVTRPKGQNRSAVRLCAETGEETFVLLDQTQAAPQPKGSFDALQALPVAIGLVNRDGQLTRVNDETRHLLRLQPDQTPRFSDVLEGLGRPVAEWLEDIRAGRVKNATEVLRASNPAADLFLQVSLRPYGPDGQLLAIMNDATEFKALEAKFTQSQKMQAIGQLAGGIAHDFNNLLTAISGHCDLILLRHDRSDIDYPDLMQIQQNTNRAASLVRQLLAFSRKQTLQFETLDVHDLLADAIHLLNRLVGERVTLTLRHGADIPLIRSDKRQFEQVLMNLVVNARDAMPMGGEIVIATERCTLPGGLRRDKATLPPGDYAVIHVRDEGVGMPPAVIAKVFDPFFSTKRQGEGTGLGLSTVYGIIKQSGGFIFVDSVEGHGTTFSIYFAAQAAPMITPQRNSSPQPVVTAAIRSTVLLVEDEAPVRSFAARALQLQGHRVLEADCGEAALEILKDPSVRPDVFVTDVIMPGLDGPAWVAKIRNRFPTTPIVFMSGYAEDSRVAAQARFGAAIFIGKPFSLAEFTEVVNAQIQKLSEAV